MGSEENRMLLEALGRDIADIKKFLIGDGTESNPGAMTRIDRLEQKSKTASQFSTAALGAVIAAAGTWVVSKILH